MYQDYYNFLKPKGRIEVGLKQMDTGLLLWPQNTQSPVGN